ncbi:MAG: hypothetical protein FWC65_04035 [Treponema sp.]|nr:hypothetical protein [Treponema sp.]
MNICINGKPANITLDIEKTLGDVLSGIELWISSSGNRIREISADGQLLDEETLSGAFDRDVKEIKDLDILVSAYRELAGEALEVLRETCLCYGGAAFDDRQHIAQVWDQSAAAHFLKADISDIYDLAQRAFRGEGLGAQDLAAVIEERVKEIANPAGEIAASEPLIKSVAARMEELPLDMQTGKDQRAAQTMQLFSAACEKLFRVFFILESEGLSLDAFAVDGVSGRVFMDEFNAALTEITAAYENRDTVLVGDLSEYELAPRLLKFFSALKDFSEISIPS